MKVLKKKIEIQTRVSSRTQYKIKSNQSRNHRKKGVSWFVADIEVDQWFFFSFLFFYSLFIQQLQQDGRCGIPSHGASCCCAQRRPFHIPHVCSGKASHQCGCASECASWRAARKPCGRSGRCTGRGFAGRARCWREGSSGGVAKQG